MNSSDAQRGPRLSVEELRQAAAEMRAISQVDIFAAGSGHGGGTLSIMDIAATLYLRVLNHDPKDPNWPDRDRVFWSAGHKALALYVALGKAGYFPLDDTVLLRQLGSRFEGHPNCHKVPGVEISSGSLGQGLSVAVGNALAGRLLGRPYRVYCIMGDGEQQEGNVWEAAMAAGHYHLDNLCAVIDCNQLQIDGRVSDVMGIEPLGGKYRAFTWDVLEIDGHDMDQILDAFGRAAATQGRPTVIIARTTKGKGVSFMENEAQWHAGCPDRAQFKKAMEDLRTPSVTPDRIDAMLSEAARHVEQAVEKAKDSLPKFSRDYSWNTRETMQVDMDPSHVGFGRGLETAGADERVVTVHADISQAICIDRFEADHPERDQRVFSVGIAEQNMIGVAAGLAKEGLIPVTGSFAGFASGRPWDQIRTTICYSNLNVKIVGAAAGFSGGKDGATHQALEEISLMSILPQMCVLTPCDSVETERATVHCLLEVTGPAYIRFARWATPVVTSRETPFKLAVANIIRYRGEKPRFLDAFETFLSTGYSGEGEEVSLVACGPMVAEAMRAAWLLKEEYGLESRVVNVHTVKPLDVAALAQAADQTSLVVTVEEHQVGGFGNIVAGAMLRHRRDFEHPFLLDMVGVTDCFGLSGELWQLWQTFGLTGEHIAERVLRLNERRR